MMENEWTERIEELEAEVGRLRELVDGAKEIVEIANCTSPARRKRKGGRRMASSYSPWIYRKILYKIPFLFKRCYAQNYHWFWDRFCFCCENEHFAIGKDYPGQSGEWHGGIRDFKTGMEYIRYHPQEDLKLNASMLAKQCDRAMSLEIDNMELRRELWRSHFPHTTKCDACGEIIRDDEKNVGYECDLHERCAHE